MNRKNSTDMEKFISVAKALCDTHRVRALLALRNGELCVCQIIELMNLAPSTVSKHMSVLKVAGLVQSRKDGRWIYYRMVDKEKCDQGIWNLIALSVSLLEQDETIKKDFAQLQEITSLGLEELCKRQKCED